MKGGENTLQRKNENLHALYSILDYCEETFVCRRQMQLNFLGEAYDPSKCDKMCDNCKKGYKISDVDWSDDAIKIVKMLSEYK
jgi:bloom syndrome protein